MRKRNTPVCSRQIWRSNALSNSVWSPFAKVSTWAQSLTRFQSLTILQKNVFFKFQMRFCEDLKEESVICEFFVVRFEMLVLWVFYKSVCSWENSVMAYVIPLRNISQKQGSWQKVLRTSLNLGELPPPIIPFGLLLYASARQATADISCDKQCDKTCSHANVNANISIYKHVFPFCLKTFILFGNEH